MTADLAVTFLALDFVDESVRSFVDLVVSELEPSAGLGDESVFNRGEYRAIGSLVGGLEFAMQERSWYCVRLVTKDGERYLLAKRIPTQREAPRDRRDRVRAARRGCAHAARGRERPSSTHRT